MDVRAKPRQAEAEISGAARGVVAVGPGKRERVDWLNEIGSRVIRYPLLGFDEQTCDKVHTAYKGNDFVP